MRLIPLSLLFLCFSAMAENNSPDIAAPLPGQIVVTGTVPDEASKVGILTKLRTIYGDDKVVDQITIGKVVLPANWNNHVQKIIDPQLKAISHGMVQVDGHTVNLRGEVANEAIKQQLASSIATSLNASYTINNGLRVSSNAQYTLDAALANRIIEFNVGNAVLTNKGQSILDELAVTLRKLKNKKVEVIGHTDNTGLRSSNIALSRARAYAVRDYLIQSGIPADNISANGVGFDNPIASNLTVEGRARNRRIEFRVVE